MYIETVKIQHIRSIKEFEMRFPAPAGWHVLIGDNGSGKSSIIRALTLGVLGLDNANALASFEDFSRWLPPEENFGKVSLNIVRDNEVDMPAYKASKQVQSAIDIKRINGNGKVILDGKVIPNNALWGDYSGTSGWFIAAYGPFRRLRGGTEAFAHIINSRPRLGACLSAFRDDVALTQLTAWLKDLALDARKKSKAKTSLDALITFINTSGLLPGDAVLLDDIDSEGIKIRDANGVPVSIFESSDGFRSILSMTIDIIRFLMETYTVDKVFKNKDQSAIDLPGVILIDEVDAHLHPVWQTRIGEWFTRFFPNIQFIVTTHSPLVCRAAEKGTIWRLAAPGSGEQHREITGDDKKRLVLGNILDAYGTELFGESPVRSEKGNQGLEELGQLNMKFVLATLTPEEESRRFELQKIFTTDAATGFQEPA